MKTILAAILCCGLCVSAVSAQFRSTNDWMTENADAQRTATVRTDPVINKDFVAQPGNLKFLWKLKLKNQPNQLNNLSSPATLELLIGYRGFRMLGFVAGSGDNLFTIDTDLGRMEWEKKLKAAPAVAPSTLACPGGMTTGVVRPTVSAISAPRGGGFGGGRSTPAVSTVGESGAGATTLSEVRGSGFSPPPSALPSDKSGPKTPPMGGVFGGGANVIYALASDGMIHAMHLSNGADFHPPVRFLPAGANAHGLIIVDGMAYAVTTNGCGTVPNGVWSLDFDTQKVSTWKGNVAGSAGAAFGPDGTIYVATNEEAPGAPAMSPAMSIVAIDAKTLQTKSVYTASRIFVSTPVVFQHQGITLIATVAIDGAIYLLDAANMATALSVSPATAKGAAPSSLASYVDAGGTRWILVAHTGALPSGFSGIATQGAILAYKISEDGKLVAGWASRNLVAPLTPTVINGVVFATSSGEFKTQDSKVTAARSGRAVLYALDGATGKEVWSSGSTITSFARGGALSGGAGQLYLTTYDGTIYAFGHSIEH